ncbi:hypothetical protein [Thalassotalea sp. Y01]|uniref:hypothetical protein n=1 Tax=Thalassotalea sp. Y01 TaxID=2729613 RepID=UPI00145E3E48|nr:hypothetical protein [Thalassotalea sp. Y01]NMP16118.1 hypothetical protein [Thalassotalea sp. Y01]
MEDIFKFLKLFNEVEEREWLIKQLGKKGLVILENQRFWDETLLAQALNEYTSRDAKLLVRLRNNWRQYKFKMNRKSIGDVTFQVSISRHANSNLLSLQRQSKLTNSAIFEHLVNDTFQSEMAEQRLQTLRVKEIKLSEQLAKTNRVRFQNLSNRLNKISNGAKVADELTSALSQISELTTDKEQLIKMVRDLEKTLESQKDELKKLEILLSAEKRLNSKLMNELKDTRN